jgi:hypothetical protein
VVVPAPELSSVDVAVGFKIGERWAFRKGQTADRNTQRDRHPNTQLSGELANPGRFV